MIRVIRSTLWLVLVLVLSIGTFVSCGGEQARDPNESVLASFPLEKALANGLPTVAEFSWRECIPCKAMRPILEELAVEYKDKANILIVEIPYHEDLADKYAVRVMPIQIFFDRTGREVARHVGFLEKEYIVAQLKKMGVQ